MSEISYSLSLFQFCPMLCSYKFFQFSIYDNSIKILNIIPIQYFPSYLLLCVRCMSSPVEYIFSVHYIVIDGPFFILVSFQFTRIASIWFPPQKPQILCLWLEIDRQYWNWTKEQVTMVILGEYIYRESYIVIYIVYIIFW